MTKKLFTGALRIKSTNQLLSVDIPVCDFGHRTLGFMWDKMSKSRLSDFLAHLSRRLTGELIGYQWIRRPSVRRRRPFTFSNIFSSETAWPIKAKFYVEPPWEGGTKVCINGPGHMTKMAAMPIYGKNLKTSSSPEPEGL